MGLNGNYLTVDLMNEIQNDMAGLEYYLMNAGYVYPNVLSDPTWPEFPPYNIKALFNMVEENTVKIDNVVDWINPYSAAFEWKKQNGAIFSHVNRWWQWLEFNMSIINRERQKQQYLTNKSNDFIVDKNGEKILTYEGFFGKG